MIRIVITPDSRKLSLKLPTHFVGKQVEVIAFTLEEVKKEPEVMHLTQFASERVLAKEWLTSEEDLAWQDL
jgi:hypothetical protein